MNRTLIGWIFVAVQAVLLLVIVVLARRSDWPIPPWLDGLGAGLVAVGLIAIGVASLRLGPALTPTPVPTAMGQLTTTGLYQYVRHPIYTGVLVIVAGLTIRSGSWIALGVAAIATGFFHVKAHWEEEQLEEKYPGYADYATRTPRFLPRPWRS